ncbi:MAG TPA: DMT family transporter [Opitutaceae bacterium]|nr:DMT family transporter [Opitutaceae bacterium]
MRTNDYILLTGLAAIWGASFLFMRIAAPVLGPVLTTDARVIIASVVLLGWLKYTRADGHWHLWKHYLVAGVIMSAFPYLCFAYAALHIPAGYSAILNSSSPMFGAIFGAIWLGETMTTRKVAGLVVGMAGVALISLRGSVAFDDSFVPAVLACLIAAASYGISGVYVKKFIHGAGPVAIATGSQLMAGLVLLVPALLTPVPGTLTAEVAGAVVALAVLCTAVALIGYFKLFARVGPTKAITVTFLLPPFGMLWGFLFLGEAITLRMLGGCALVLAGTLMATGFKWPRREVGERAT